MFRPKLFETLKYYSKEQFIKDLGAGIIVGIIAIPLSIALGISSGVSPQQGLITAVIAGFLISFLGGSRVQIGGPTGAFVVILYGIILKFGYQGLAIATIMSGIILIIMGLLKLGSLIKYMPQTITAGFTSGIAVVIFIQQLNDFFGLSITKMPGETIEKVITIAHNFYKFNPWTFAVGLIALLIIIIWNKFFPKIPGPLIAIIITTLLVKLFNLPVATIGSRFPDITGSIKFVGIPQVTLDDIYKLIPSAITIALLAGIESLMSAVVSDKLVVDRHESNTELIAQGVANIASPLFGGIAATGAIARTYANVRNGGRTPIAGMIHAITVLVIMLIIMPLAKLIPMPALAAVLIIVAYNMSNWREFQHLTKTTKSDITVLVVTFLLTVIIDLVVAIEIGLILAVLFFFLSMTRKSNISVNKELSNQKHIVISVNGPFFFAAADAFSEFIKTKSANSQFIILSLENSLHMDATGLTALTEVADYCKITGKTLILCDTPSDVEILLHKANITSHIGPENIFSSVTDAINSVDSRNC